MEQYGLIEREVQGLGRLNRIYVKNFIRSRKTGVQDHENRDSGVTKMRIQDSRKSNTNNTEYINTEMNDTDLILSAGAAEQDEKMALNGSMIQMDLSDVKEMIWLLRINANNLNQYARKAKISKMSDEEFEKLELYPDFDV